MNPIILSEALTRLVADYAFKKKSKWLQDGKCPSCHHKELFASAEAPWVIKCGRLNNCSYEGSLRELYPDLFESWSDRFKADDKNPNAAADAYLKEARGFDLNQIKGLYSQDNYFSRDLGIGSATVRFPFADGYWERLIDKPERFKPRKANFKYGWNYDGLWWTLPNVDLSQAKEIWITEGIFNAIALEHNHIRSVSTLSSGNYPSTALKALATQCLANNIARPTLVWAMDNDPAGHKAIEKWMERAIADGWPTVAVQAPKNNQGKSQDWNDLHLADKLSPKDIDTYRYYGNLLTAKTSTEKALLIYKHTERRAFTFDHNHRLYWFKLDLEAYEKKMSDLRADEDDQEKIEALRDEALASSGGITEIASCNPTPLYFLENKLTDESWYYFRIKFYDGKEIKNTFTGAQLASNSEFKKRLLSIAGGALYTGNGHQLDNFLRYKVENIKTVETIDFIGYSKEYSTYVFNKIAVKDGKVYQLNNEDYFDLGKINLKSLNQSVNLHLNPKLKEFDSSFIPKIHTCFGDKGIVALAYWLGSFFAEQIRQHQQSYPFLEIVGEPGAGKTTLIEFLWKLSGRIGYEGFDPSKSTLSGRSRNMAQVGNLPVVLMEGDRDDDSKAKKFDFDELKPLYNGRSPRAVGIKNSGNETYEPPFRGAVIIAQNAEVNASDAVLERLIHLGFKRGQRATRELAKELAKIDVNVLSGFMIKAVTLEKEILNTFFKQTPIYETLISQCPDIKNVRIGFNHAQIMALVDALDLVIPLSPELKSSVKNSIIDLAIERQQRINQDHPFVQQFWEVYDYIESRRDKPTLNHAHHSKDYIAINLNHFAEEALAAKQNLADLTELKRILPTSMRYRFVESNRVVRSNIHKTGNEDRIIKCWIFNKPQAN
jgi:hypothetical protein